VVNQGNSTGQRPAGAVAGAVVAAIVVIGAFVFIAFGTGHHKTAVAAAATTSSSVASVAPSAPAITASSPATTAAGCTWAPDTSGNPNLANTGAPPTSGYPTAGTQAMTLKTSQGTIVIALDDAHAPCAAASFTYLAGKKFFDGTSCHRLVTSGPWVLQCGDPTGTGSGGPSYTFPDENLPTGASGYGVGVVAMANGGPDTNGSQFFLIYKDSSALPPAYSVIGTITSGLSVLQKIAAGGVTPVNAPTDGTPKLKTKITKLTVSKAS
jgi:peptidyl-prolyl cis-trans isomerase B (cyclophilin B)